MTGDKYRVFYSVGGGTVPYETFDSWRDAKEARNNIFFSDRKTRAAWIMRDNPSLNARPELYGNTLRRTKYEAAD